MKLTAKLWASVWFHSCSLGHIGLWIRDGPGNIMSTIIIRLCFLYIQKDTCKIEPRTERKVLKSQNALKTKTMVL